MATKEKPKSNVTKLREGAENMISEEETREFMIRQEGFDERLATHKGVYMQKCKGVRDDRAAYEAQQAQKGIPVRALKAVYKAQKKLDEAKALVHKLPEEQVPVFEHAAKQLDLPF